jgi:hypothetical protein
VYLLSNSRCYRFHCCSSKLGSVVESGVDAKLFFARLTAATTDAPPRIILRIIGVRGLHRCLKLANKTLGEPERLIRVKPERRAGSQARPNRLRKDSGGINEPARRPDGLSAVAFLQDI